MKGAEARSCLVIHVQRVGLGIVRAVSTLAIVFKFGQNKPFKVTCLWKTSDVFGSFWMSLEIFRYVCVIF